MTFFFFLFLFKKHTFWRRKFVTIKIVTGPMVGYVISQKQIIGFTGGILPFHCLIGHTLILILKYWLRLSSLWRLLSTYLSVTPYLLHMSALITILCSLSLRICELLKARTLSSSSLYSWAFNKYFINKIYYCDSNLFNAKLNEHFIRKNLSENTCFKFFTQGLVTILGNMGKAFIWKKKRKRVKI